MLKINKFLLRFSTVNNSKKQKESIMEILLEEGIKTTTTRIIFKKNTIFLREHPVVKMEILLKKKELIKKIQTIPGCEFFVDMR